MKKPHPTPPAQPIRLSLVEQTAEYLREGLRGNRWAGGLPTEGELGHELGVSRGTLRNALAGLLKEGVLQPGGRGGRHAVNTPVGRDKKSCAPLPGNLVRLLSPQPRSIIGGDTQIVFQTIAEILGRAGLHLEFEYRPGCGDLRHSEATLRKLTAQPNTAGWILYRSSRFVQEWFARSGIPVVVLGGVFPGVALSHAEIDLVAACRHAAGIFVSRGHRRMVFLSVESATAGDVASGLAFGAAATSAGAHAETVLFDDTVPGLCHQLDRILRADPAPTAFLVAMPNHLQPTIGHLTRRGYPVPQLASVISRLDSRMLAEFIPSVARYAVNAERLGRGTARLMILALRGKGAGGVRRSLVMPTYVDGETAGLSAVSFLKGD